VRVRTVMVTRMVGGSRIGKKWVRVRTVIVTRMVGRVKNRYKNVSG